MPPSQPCGACQPASQPDYTRPAIDAITQAAARLGSSNTLTARRPGSWEASLVDQLVKGTVGYHDELLPSYTGHSPSAQTTN